MAVYSDGTILGMFSRLIDGGDPERARGCAYSFVTGKIFPSPNPDSATARGVVDWTTRPVSNWPGEEVYEVRPGELVTLRTREIVKMPNDLCGVWNQTDALARNGLLLVNLSTVPPGYEGHLTCTFVNFGKNNVRIQPDIRIAKLMFLRLDQDAKHPSRPWNVQSYDSKMAATASDSPATFLRVSEQSRKIEELVKAGLDEIRKVCEKSAEDARNELMEDLESARAGFQKHVVSDTRGALLRASPIAILAIALLTAAQWGSARFLTSKVEDVARRRADQIEEKIDRQLEAARTKPVFVYSGTEESKVLLDRMRALETEIQQLKAKEEAK